MARTSLVTRRASTGLARSAASSPLISRLKNELESKTKSLAKFREKHRDLQAGVASRGAHLMRASMVQAGAFAAGLVSLENKDEERMLGPVPVPVAMGAALVGLGMLVPGESMGAHALVSAGSGALAGYSFTKGQELGLAWLSSDD